MQVIVAVTGHTLVIMYMAIFYHKLWSGSYAVIVFMPVVEGYITDYPMGMAELTGFFTSQS